MARGGTCPSTSPFPTSNTHATGQDSDPCRGDGDTQLICVCVMACGLAATSLYNSLALDQVPPIPLNCITRMPDDPALHVCFMWGKMFGCYLKNLSILPKPNSKTNPKPSLTMQRVFCLGMPSRSSILSRCQCSHVSMACCRGSNHNGRGCPCSEWVKHGGRGCPCSRERERGCPCSE